MPIVHVPGQGLTSVSALKNFTSAKNPNSINPLSIGNRVNAERQNTSNNNAGKFVNKLLGTSTGTFNTDDIDQAIKAMNNKFKPADQLDTFFSKASSLAQSKDVNTFSFVGSTMFTDDVLKTLRPPISKTTGIPDTKDNATFYKNKRVIEKITEELKKNNFVPQNGIDPTDLDTLKTTAFVRKQ